MKTLILAQWRPYTEQTYRNDHTTIPFSFYLYSAVCPTFARHFFVCAFVCSVFNPEQAVLFLNLNCAFCIPVKFRVLQLLGTFFCAFVCSVFNPEQDVLFLNLNCAFCIPVKFRVLHNGCANLQML